MAKDKKLVEGITSMDVDFAQWYTDVVKKAELCDYTSVKGCMVIKPAGYAIWENIQKELDRRFKETGVENVYLPMLIPESLLQKEKDHVEGFAPEVAWVTHGGLEPLQERMCIRPTSETLFCDFYQKEVHSYRDLPKVYNQWCSVLRWEKTTRPFLRSREFLWQEGHTVHATEEDAEARTQQMLNVYADFCEQVLAMPVIKGRKEVVYPEKDMAIRLGKRLISNNFLDYIMLDNSVEIRQILVPNKLCGETIMNSNFRKKYGLNIIAIQKGHNTMIEISPDYQFEPEDVIVVIGKIENINRLEQEM